MACFIKSSLAQLPPLLKNIVDLLEDSFQLDTRSQLNFRPLVPAPLCIKDSTLSFKDKSPSSRSCTGPGGLGTLLLAGKE